MLAVRREDSLGMLPSKRSLHPPPQPEPPVCPAQTNLELARRLAGEDLVLGAASCEEEGG